MTIVAFVFTILVSAIFGATTMVVAWLRHFRKPDNARALMKHLYRRAHPHWLQRSPEDSTRTCPCCGWSEGGSVDTPVEAP